MTFQLSKRAKLRRAGFGLKSARVPFFAAIAIFFFFFWESFYVFEQGAAKERALARRPHDLISAFVHILPAPPIHSLQDGNAIHPLQLGLRALDITSLEAARHHQLLPRAPLSL